MKTPKPQPPPDGPLHREVPAGYRIEWFPAPEWRLAGPDDRAEKCRRVGCTHQPVAVLLRPTHQGPRRLVPYRYCADHLYGRRVSGDRVETPRLVKAVS